MLIFSAARGKMVQEGGVPEMGTINSRIAQVVKESGLTKTAFAAAIKVSQPYLSQLCGADLRTPSDRTIADICEKFCINEAWLRTGEGEMKSQLSRDEELAKIFEKVQVTDDERSRLVRAFASLPEEAYPQLYHWFMEMAKTLTGNSDT